MVATSQADESSFEILEDQIRECFGRVVYTQKTQEKSADETLALFNWMKWIQIALSAISTTGFIAVLFGKPEVSGNAARIAGVVSLLLVGLNSYMQGKDLGQLSEKHKATAAALWDIRESYFSLLTDLASRLKTTAEVIEKRDHLQERLAKIYETAPRTTGGAYREASDGLKNREELTFSDEEIDKFLPSKLRRGKQ